MTDGNRKTKAIKLKVEANSVRERLLTSRRGRKQPSPCCSPALAVAIAVAAVMPMAIIVVPVHGWLIRVMSVDTT